MASVPGGIDKKILLVSNTVSRERDIGLFLVAIDLALAWEPTRQYKCAILAIERVIVA